jgi:beta-glucosidase
MTRKNKVSLAGSLAFLILAATLIMFGPYTQPPIKKASLRTAPAENDILSDSKFPKNFPPAKFPDNFILGVAISSYQTGSIGRNSDWWEWERGHDPVRLNEPADDYHIQRQYEQDFTLAQDIGLTHYRLSIDWSLIEPEEGKWDKGEIAHYREQLLDLKKRGITPVICLNHFVLPKWVADKGGWTNPEVPVLFGRYTEKVARELGKPLKIKLWLTFNEPTAIILCGYIKGEYPPGLRENWVMARIAFRNLARAHKIAYCILHKILDTKHEKIWVGIAGMTHSYLASSKSAIPGLTNPLSHANMVIARGTKFLYNEYFFEITEDYHDFIGINYYKEYTLKLNPWSRLFLTEYERGEISPEGLYRVIKDYAFYGKPIIITENGLNTDDEKLRIKFIAAHLLAIRKAMDEGVDVRGYFYWTLADTYEWNEGYTAHFGLIGINRQTQERTPRQSARFFKDVIEENGVSTELVRKHLESPKK